MNGGTGKRCIDICYFNDLPIHHSKAAIQKQLEKKHGGLDVHTVSLYSSQQHEPTCVLVDHK